MRKRIITLSLLSAISFGSIIKASESVSILCSKDNTIIQSATGSLSNALYSITAGRTNQDAGAAVTSIRRALVYFDVANHVPVNATIDSVRLSMYFSRTSGVGTNVDLHRVLKDWGEGTSMQGGGQGATATQNDVTWLYTFNNVASPTSSPAWTTPGGDFDPTVSATIYAGTGLTSTGADAYGLKYFVSTTMTSEVQNWLNTPSSNFGWVLQGDETKAQTAKQFLSRETGDATTSPLLKVYYTVSGGIPMGINSGLAVKFTTYPNPASDYVTVSFTKASSEKVFIYNTCGTLVKTVQANNEEKLNIELTDMKPGIYLIKAGSYTSKLMVK
ncbi:DNRLRE domain-containing protein [Parabacteroides sp. FAFU027]|uniref:T9SS type A sorting domain-containing protein n=1 Tax=Parabacteroides sp. FAFU027 TaxID=2922715 RepID=UPI001FAEBA71|nr:DNRLRE domain-containing protein [Parabacteroides sp. FAFU027]